MSVQLLEQPNLSAKTNVIDEQRLTLPSHYSWQQFLEIEMWLAGTTGLRITYLDGNIELMTFKSGLVPSIAFWEIAIKIKNQKLDLGVDIDDYLATIKKSDVIRIIPIIDNYKGVGRLFIP